MTAGAGPGGALPKRPEMSRRAPIKLREDDEYGVEREVIKESSGCGGRGQGRDPARRPTDQAAKRGRIYEIRAGGYVNCFIWRDK